MEEVLAGALQNCFSVAVAAFLLLRMERELKCLREAIDRLRYCQICRFAAVEPGDAQAPPARGSL